MSNKVDIQGSVSNEDLGPGNFTNEQKNIIDELIHKAVKDVRIDVRNDMAGLNRKNDNLKKAIDERDAELRQLRSQMADNAESWKKERDIQRAEIEAEKARDKAEIEAERKELQLAKNRAKADSFMSKHSMPDRLLKFVSFNDEAQMFESLDELKSIIDAERNEIDRMRKIKGGDRPMAGSSITPKINKSKMSPKDATKYVEQHGLDAFRALPD